MDMSTERIIRRLFWYSVTAYSIVKRMCDKIPGEDWSDPTKTFLESSFGNGQFLIVGFCCESERSSPHAELIIESTYDVDGALTFDMTVERHGRYTIGGGRIAHLFIKR